MSSILDRLTAWRPSMREYHSGPELSSGFLRDVATEGLSVALSRRGHGGPTTDPRMARGAWLHALFTGDTEVRFHVAPTFVRRRYSAGWDVAVKEGRGAGVDAVLLADDVIRCWSAWWSLLGPDPAWQTFEESLRSNVMAMGSWGIWFHAWLENVRGLPVPADTPAKVQIRAMLKRWLPRFPEVSYRWEPPEVPGARCRIRQDLVAQAPSGAWYSVQLKTTEASLSTWWRYWRQYVRAGSAFYRAGEQHLFGDELSSQLLVVVRMVEPYPWAVFSLDDRAEELDAAWRNELVPMIEWVSDALNQGEYHGPEEKGLQL